MLHTLTLTKIEICSFLTYVYTLFLASLNSQLASDNRFPYSYTVISKLLCMTILNKCRNISVTQLHPTSVIFNNSFIYNSHLDQSILFTTTTWKSYSLQVLFLYIKIAVLLYLPCDVLFIALVNWVSRTLTLNYAHQYFESSHRLSPFSKISSIAFSSMVQIVITS